MKMQFVTLTTLFLITGTLVAAQNYAVGQIWEYDTRENEKSSRIYIVEKNAFQNGTDVFHIYIEEIRLINPFSKTGFQDHIQHFPVDQITLDSSVTRLAGTTADFPDYHEGYNRWKEGFDAGEAGAFTIPIKELVQMSEDAINQMYLQETDNSNSPKKK